MPKIRARIEKMGAGNLLAVGIIVLLFTLGVMMVINLQHIDELRRVQDELARQQQAQQKDTTKISKSVATLDQEMKSQDQIDANQAGKNASLDKEIADLKK